MRRTKRFATIAVVVAMSGAAWAEPNPDAPKRAPNLTLPNTEDGLTRVKWPREKLALVSVGDQGGSDQVQTWTKAIRDRFGDRLDYVPIAWLEAIPQNMKSTVETIIKTQHSGVLMDWSGSAAERFGCQAGKANIYLVAPGGRILFAQSGEMPDGILDRFEERIAKFEANRKKRREQVDESETD